MLELYILNEKEKHTKSTSICPDHWYLKELELEHALNTEMHVLPFAQVVTKLHIQEREPLECFYRVYEQAIHTQ